MTDDVKAVAQRILDRTADQIGAHFVNCHEYHLPCFAAFVLTERREAATVAPAVDREALARFFDPWAWDYGDPSKGAVQVSRAESLAKADAVLASGLLRDVREVQAEALEGLADELDDSNFEVIHDADWIRELAQAIREARSGR